jgi:HAD superfamily hydrolase (TIGR01450 family)
MPLADEFDGLLVDLDGVVWVGGEMVPGAVETLTALLDAGKEIVFVTNNPGRSGAAYAQRLREAGIPTSEERVLTAGVVTARLAAEATEPGGGAFVIGAAGLKGLVGAAGVRVLEGERGREAGVVVVSGHREFDYEELLTATLALQGGAALFATSRDPTMPMPGGAWPGTGAILAAVETASGATATIGGKPERHLFELALKTIRGSLGKHDVPKEPRTQRVAMVGDRIASDIEGGRRAGLETILVLSGATSRPEAEAAEPPPDHLVDDVSGLLR